VHDWAEVHRLVAAGKTNTDIARALHMSRNTVARLRGLPAPPAYEPPAAGSMLDEYKDAVAALLRDDPEAPVTVDRRAPATGGLPRWDHDPEGVPGKVRPQFLAAKPSTTSALPTCPAAPGR
jgi:hypothetical protein